MLKNLCFVFVFTTLSIGCDKKSASDSHVPPPPGQGEIPIAPPADADGSTDFITVTNLFNSKCSTCHSSSRPPDFSIIKTEDDAISHFEVLSRSESKVRSGEMPPPNAPPATDQEKQAFRNWIETTAAKMTAISKPAETSLRRLSKNELVGSMIDLFGEESSIPSDFPEDAHGYGFTNIAANLFFDSEKLGILLSGFERILDKVLKHPSKIIFNETIVTPREMAGGGLDLVNNRRKLDSTNEYTSAGVFVEGEANYRLTIRAHAEQAGSEIAQMIVRVNGRNVAKVTVPTTDILGTDYSFDVHLLPGENILHAVFANDYWDPSFPDPTKQDRNLRVNLMKVAGPISGTIKVSPFVRRFLSCYRGETKVAPACMAEAIAKFAHLAWRRPADEATTAQLLNIAAQHESVDDPFDGLKAAYAAILLSPRFLYRNISYLAGESSPSERLGEELSFFLWSGLPDTSLLDQMKRGTLTSPPNLQNSIRKMLKDPKSERFIDNFFSQWMTIDNLRPDSPQSTQSEDMLLRESAIRESQLLFKDLIQFNQPVRDLLLADYGHVDGRLADLYDVAISHPPNVFKPVSLEGTPRRGILGHASVQMATSFPNRTSPVLRGKFALDQLLCSPPLPPPPDVGGFERVDPTLPLREQMAQHRSNPLCASCHERMDNIGFAFEEYGFGGDYRYFHNGQPIDTTGVLPNGDTFKNSFELNQILARDKRLASCVTEKFFIYATGRGPQPADAPGLTTLQSRITNETGFSDLVEILVDSYLFRGTNTHVTN